MRYSEKSIEAKLQKALKANTAPVDNVHFQTTLEQAKIEQQKRAVKQDKHEIQSALIMAKRGGRKFALMQAILLTLCLMILSRYLGDSTISMYTLDTAIGAMSVLTLLSAVPYLKRAKANHMLELEIASCVNPNTLILARLLPMLISEMSVILGIVLFCASSFDVAMERVLLSALLPYLTVSTLSGLLLIWADGEHFTEICLSVGTVVFCFLLIRNELFSYSVFEINLLPGFLLCITLALIYLLQVKKLAQMMAFKTR